MTSGARGSSSVRSDRAVHTPLTARVQVDIQTMHRSRHFTNCRHQRRERTIRDAERLRDLAPRPIRRSIQLDRLPTELLGTLRWTTHPGPPSPRQTSRIGCPPSRVNSIRSVGHGLVTDFSQRGVTRGGLLRAIKVKQLWRGPSDTQGVPAATTVVEVQVAPPHKSRAGLVLEAIGVPADFVEQEVPAMECEASPKSIGPVP